jgi:hypothetical protein
MTPNLLYQALVRELETLMPPRVASPVLRSGLAAVGADPASLDLEQASALLKGTVFRQLQTTRTPEQARASVAELLEHLTALAAPTPPEAAARDDEAKGGAATPADPAPSAPAEGDGADEERIAQLHAELRPLNLYFGWAEVRKLRAQVQLIDDEKGAGRDPGSLVDEAEAQLALIHQKVEDHLVLQARDLADLEESLEVVAGLGGSRVRRLESLIATVREAQGQRTVAEAEVERAQTLARGLRKLVESSVLDEGDAPPDLGRGDGRPTRRGAPDRPAPRTAGPDAATTPPGAATPHADAALGDASLDAGGPDAGPPDADALDPAVRERLQALDVDGERRSLETLHDRYAEVLRFAPAHQGAFDAIRAEHELGRPASAALEALAAALAAEETDRRTALSHEFQALRADLEALPDQDRVTDARRAVHVVLDVLADALPALDDVTAARELHAEVSERSEANARAASEAERRAADLETQRLALRERLAAAVARAPEGLPEQGSDALREAWTALTEALGTLDGTAVDTGALEHGRDVEAAWERALAASSDDRAERLRARARELVARVGQVPELPALRARRTALAAEVGALEHAPDLTPAHVRTLTSIVDQLFDDARAATIRRLDELAREAGDVPPESLARALQAAARHVEQGTFPDLASLEAQVRAATDERRTEARRRYLRARQGARRLAAAEVPGSADLEPLVAEARVALDGDDPNPAIDRLEAQLAAVEGEVEARLARFDERLDAALAAFRRVALLNNDDVTATRRVLTHLDGQRASVRRISFGLQARLFDALTDAEGRLRVLEEAFEATRAIADRLVAGNLLDDVLGGFDALFGGAEAANAEVGQEPDAASPEAGVDAGVDPDRDAASDAGEAPTERDDARLAALWAPYLDLDEVAGAVVLDRSGEVRAGRPAPGSDLPALTRSLQAASEPWRRLGDRLGDAAPDVALVDLGGPPTLVAALADVGHAVVWTTGPGAGSDLDRRLRGDRDALVDLLSPAAPAPSDRGPA